MDGDAGGSNTSGAGGESEGTMSLEKNVASYSHVDDHCCANAA